MLLTSYEREKLKAFANLNSDSKRDDFVRFNPEVKKSRFAIEALLVAQGAWQKKQIPTAWMYAIAAFFLGGEISDTFIGAEAAKLAMETAPLTGNSHLTNMFRASEFALREESKSRIQPLPNNSVQIILSETLLKTKVAFPNIDNCYSQVKEGAKACYYSTAPQQVIEELIKGLNSNEPEVIMLSMLILGILSLATDAKISIEPINRTLALYTNNKFSVENSAQLILCIIDNNPETKEMKKQYMTQFKISDEREYNGIAIYWIIKELCTMEKSR